MCQRRPMCHPPNCWLHDWILDSIPTPKAKMGKGKSSTKASDALRDLKDLSSFQQSIPVSLGISLKHLVDTWFVQLGNFVLLRRDITWRKLSLVSKQIHYTSSELPIVQSQIIFWCPPKARKSISMKLLGVLEGLDQTSCITLLRSLTIDIGLMTRKKSLDEQAI